MTDPSAPREHSCGSNWSVTCARSATISGAGYDNQRCAFTDLARAAPRQVVHLTSLQPLLGDSRPFADDAAKLVTAAEQLRPVPLILIAPLDVLRAVAVAPDLPAALSACVPQALLSRGVPS